MVSGIFCKGVTSSFHLWLVVHKVILIHTPVFYLELSLSFYVLFPKCAVFLFEVRL